MKKIKLPLEMANGAMVRTIDELKENWDLEKVVEHFVTGKLTTWLNDRYYTDLAEKVENLPKDGDGRKLQQALCRVFEMPCEELELDVDEIAERKRRQDLLRQYTSDEEILNNVDKVAFDQEDLAYLLDDEVTKIYLFNNKFTIPLNVEGKKYIGIGDNAVAEIRSKKPVNFAERGIVFSNVKFDEKYQKLVDAMGEKREEERKSEEDVRVQELKKVGDIIKFGKLHTNSINIFPVNKSDRATDIEWRILDIVDGKALVLSTLAVKRDYKMNTKSDISWETCDLREWLNKDFYRNNFDSKEKGAIVLTKLKAEASPDVTMNPGNDTEDRVFLLSISEAEKYFDNNEERKRVIGADDNTHGWWLRTLSNEEGIMIGSSHNVFTYVDRVGSIFYGRGNIVMIGSYRREMSVYPAMWVDLSKL